MDNPEISKYLITIDIWHIITFVGSMLILTVGAVWSVFTFLHGKYEKQENIKFEKKEKEKDRRMTLWEERVKANDEAHASFLIEQHNLKERVLTLEGSIPRWTQIDRSIESLRDKMDKDTLTITERIHTFSLEVMKMITENQNNIK